MNIGKPQEIVEVQLTERDAPPSQRPAESPREAPAPQRTRELVPA